MAIGVTFERFMDGCPKELEPFDRAYTIKKNHEDISNWQLGQYIAAAISCIFPKGEYPDKPAFQIKNDTLTEEEKYQQELKKAIITEEKWMIACKQKGLPETVI